MPLRNFSAPGAAQGLVRAPAAVRRAAQTPCCSTVEDMAMRTNFDFSPFYRSSIGFDRVFDLLENATRVETTESWPPYDIAKTGDGTYQITMAVAGFAQDELEISAQPNLLIVTAQKRAE